MDPAYLTAVNRDHYPPGFREADVCDAETVRRFASRYRQVCEAECDRAYDEARERELERKE